MENNSHKKTIASLIIIGVFVASTWAMNRANPGLLGKSLLGSTSIINADLTQLRVSKIQPITPQQNTQTSTDISMQSLQQAETLGAVEPAKSSLLMTLRNLITPTPVNQAAVTTLSNQKTTGILSIGHFDDFDTHQSIPFVTLDTGKEVVLVKTSNDQYKILAPLSGSIIDIEGVLKGNTLVMKGENVSIIQPPVIATTSSGKKEPEAKKLSIVLYRFANATKELPFTKEDVRKNFFEKNPEAGLTMSEFLAQSTYGQFSLTGKKSIDGSRDVYGVYNVSTPRTSCDNQMEYYFARQEAIAMAQKDGLQVEADDFVVTATFPDGCPSGGLASLGNVSGKPEPVDDVRNTPNFVYRSINVNDALMWGGVLHEFGHLLNKTNLKTVGSASFKMVGHSNSLECTDQAGSPRVGIFGAFCKFVEYGSPFSILGGYVSRAEKARLFDSRNRKEGGYLTEGNYVYSSPSIESYEITKINYPDAQLLRPVKMNSWYLNGNSIAASYLTVEARDFFEFEQGTDTFPHKNVLIVYWDPPSKNGVIRVANNKKLLAPGESFYSSELGVTIINRGESLSSSRKVRVGVEYDNQKISEIDSVKLAYALKNRIVTIDSLGNLSPQPSLQGNVVSNTYSKIILLQGYLDFPVRIFPLTTAPVPLDGIISGYDSYFYEETKGNDFSFNINLLEDLKINPNALPTQPRSIYKASVHITPFGDNSLTTEIPIYIQYGLFSVEELMNLGIASSNLQTNPEQFYLPSTTSPIR